MMKTIKQIADEMGLPKHKVKYQVEKLPAHCVIKTAEFIRVTDEGQAILQDLLVERTTKNEHKSSEDILQQLVDMLNRELETKNQQIAELTAALTMSQQTAAAAQALHAGTIKHISDGETKRETGGLFSRIFKKST